MTRRRIYWLTVTLLMCAVSVAVAVAVVHRRHTVPLSRCSEVYRQYRDTPGIETAFIHNKKINDTLRLDMTILVAEDSNAFVNLLKSWGRSDEYIRDMKISIVDENSRFINKCLKGHPELPADPDNNNNEVVATFPLRKTIAIIHTKTAQQLNDIFLPVIFKEISIL